jgi:hypothetical protein
MKSSFSHSYACVDVSRDEGDVVIRHSADLEGTALHFTRAEFEAFLLGVKAGEFDAFGHTE